MLPTAVISLANARSPSISVASEASEEDLRIRRSWQPFESPRSFIAQDRQIAVLALEAEQTERPAR